MAAPAKVTVKIAGTSVTYDAPAGVYAKTFPLQAGQIPATAVRTGLTVSVTSPFPVTTKPEVQNLQYHFVSSSRKMDFNGTPIAAITTSAPTPTPAPVPTPAPTPTPAPSAPDLTIQQLTLNPASAHTGDKITFSAVVKNIGSGATPAGTVIGVTFSVDGKQISWSDTNTTSLAPGTSVTLTTNGGPTGSAIWTAASGNHTLSATVDDVKRITESDDTNNVISSMFTITDAPAQPLPVKGDINGDGHVNTLDLSILLTHDDTNYAPADLNNDGTVGAADLAILLSHWKW